jgi:hypothetical protein
MTYREGVPEAQSPCRVPELEPVPWCVYTEGRAVVVWTKYAQRARELGAVKLGVIDPSILQVRRVQ